MAKPTSARQRSVGASPMDLVQQDRLLKEIVGGEGADDRDADPLDTAAREVLSTLRLRNIHLMQRMLDDDGRGEGRRSDERPPTPKESGVLDIWKVVDESVSKARQEAYEARREALTARERESAEDNKLAGVLLKELVGLVKESSKREEKPKESEIGRTIVEVLRDPNHPLSQVVSPLLQVLSEGVRLRTSPPDFRAQLEQSREMMELVRNLAGGFDSDRKARLEDRRLELMERRMQRREQREERRDEDRRKLEEQRLGLLGEAIRNIGQLAQNLPALIIAFKTGSAAPPYDAPIETEPVYESDGAGEGDRDA